MSSQTELNLSPDPISLSAPVPGHCGAVVEFYGVVRAREGEGEIEAIEYECFEAMARGEFEKLFAEARRQWTLDRIELRHRIGVVRVGEASLWIRIRSAHRAEAFAACQWIIDGMKRKVPIWKRPVGV
ncbi:MAG: molybdenum cofactor biosynthesis protein MoaE [Verrucomicrobiae bacterium]|nr:molybdenum cofactor biosynthesis protein MoaE [Verrucomicrobiae bacterium]